MKKFMLFAISLLSVVFLIILAGVVELNPVDSFSETSDMAVDLVDDAIDLYDDIGTQAFSRINVDPEFHGMQLYVYVIRDDDGVIVAHGDDKLLIGKNTNSISDVDGKNIGEMLHNLATEDGAWIQYVSKDPVNDKNLPESVWIKKHDGYIFGSGVFLQD